MWSSWATCVPTPCFTLPWKEGDSGGVFSCRTELSALSVHSLVWVPSTHSFVNKPSSMKKINTQPTERGKKKFSTDFLCQAANESQSLQWSLTLLWFYCLPVELVSSPSPALLQPPGSPCSSNRTRHVPHFKVLCTLLFPLPNLLLEAESSQHLVA